jgi:hypothetical protein
MNFTTIMHTIKGLASESVKLGRNRHHGGDMEEIFFSCEGYRSVKYLKSLKGFEVLFVSFENHVCC